MNSESMKFQTPCSMLVSGPSQSGKTWFAIRLIENATEMFTTPPLDIYWCYAEFQPAYQRLPTHVKMINGLPSMDELRKDPTRPKLVIIDDLMMEGNKSDEITTLTTKGCHHLNTSLVFLVQNTFYKGQRTARLNMTYLVMFKSPADQSQIETLARQMYTRRGSVLLEAFKDATKAKHGYLLIDLHQTTDEQLRLRTGIFPDETTFVYAPRNA